LPSNVGESVSLPKPIQGMVEFNKLGLEKDLLRNMNNKAIQDLNLKN
jgi:hypothetical protein